MTFCVGDHKPPENKPDWQWPQATVGLLCGRCRNRLSSLLVQMPSLAEWLHENIAPGQSGAGDRVSGSREDPIPLRTDILDYIGPTSSRDVSQTEYERRQLASGVRPEKIETVAEQVGEPGLHDVVGSWCLLVSEENGDGWPNHNDLTSMCRWLHSQLGWIVAQPWVDDMLTNLTDVSRKAERLAPREAEHRLLKPPCPSCNCKALVFTRGVGVACEGRMGGCGRTWEDESFDRLVIVLGSEAMEATA